MLRKNKKLIAIVVPLSNNEVLSEDEEISLLHLNTYLSSYDRFLIMPTSLNFHVDGYYEKRFNPSYFGSVEAHRKLLFSRQFYKEFEEYEYMLIYHLDALVFSDQVKEWCSKGIDYVAPPWIKHPETPYYGNVEYEGKVGNGGFSLRKVESFLAVLDSKTVWQPHPRKRIAMAYRSLKDHKSMFLFIKSLLYDHYKCNGVAQEMDSYVHNEDHFWANRAEYYSPKFKVASVDTALKFAFECVPKYCYELNHRQLPFGCHAFNRYDPGFWKPFIISKTSVNNLDKPG